MMSVSTTSVVRACGAAASLACGAGSAHATAFSWATGVSANWNTSARWTPMGVPSSSADTASITVAPDSSPYTVTVSNGFTIGGLTLDQPQATVLIGGGGQLAMASGAAVNLTAGKLSINGGSLTQAGAGTFTMAPGSTLETFSNVTMPSGMAYTLGGAIVMDGTLQGFPAAGWTNGGAITLTGPALSWLFSTGPMTNDGTITADTAGGGRRIQTPITNSATGAIVMNADTEWRSGPHSNSGFVKVALFKTLTVGSFATVNQHAGNFLVAGSYTHLNGAFNMNGGALTVQQSFFKDGGNFAYNGGTIDGAPTLRNAVLTLNPGATNPATFALRGGGNSVSGEIGANKAIRVEATGAEQAALSGGFGNLVNRGTITLAPTETQQAALTSLGGGLMNHGTVIVEAPQADGNGTFAGAAAVLAFMFNLEGGRLEVDGGMQIFLDALRVTHANYGVMLTMDGLVKLPPGEVVVKAGSESTFKQEAGSIDNQGRFVCEATNTFMHIGGSCSGNPITIDGAALEVGPNAGPGAFDMVGPGNTLRADSLHNQLRIAVYPEESRPGGEGEFIWEPMTPGVTPTLSGMIDLFPRFDLDTVAVFPTGLYVVDGGTLHVDNEDSGTGIFSVPLPYGIRIPASATLAPGAISLSSNTRFQSNVDAEVGVIRTTFSFDDDAPARGGTPVTVEIEGNYSQGGPATLLLQLHAAGVSDEVHIAGQASLGGTLALVPGPGYAPAWGDSFTPLTFTTRLGDFASLDAPTLPTDLRWWREAGATQCLVGVRHVADTNHDGVVDFLDLNNVLSYFGLPAPPGSAATIGDANTDGVVDFLDLNHVLGAFGTSAL